MIHITSEGNLFTPFCISVAVTASFLHLTVTALIQLHLFYIQSFYLFSVRLVLIFLLAFLVDSNVLSLQLINNCACNSGIETLQVD